MNEESCLTLLQAHLDIMNCGLRHGYSLIRWQDIVNVIFLKEANNHRIHRLWVLHLFEADYNLILGVKWRQLMLHAEFHQTLNDGQAALAAKPRDLIFLKSLKTKYLTAPARPCSTWITMLPSAMIASSN
jgi:hypothetical protein